MATVAGSPYPIVFSNPKSGSYVATNYKTVYINGVMTVFPRPFTMSNAMTARTVPLNRDAAPNFDAMVQIDDEKWVQALQEN
jgi:hypothetical protein